MTEAGASSGGGEDGLFWWHFIGLGVLYSRCNLSVMKGGRNGTGSDNRCERVYGS